MVRRCFIWALLGCAWTGTGLGQNDELVVRQQSARFESARNRGALKESRRLLAAGATCYDLPGRDSRSLLYDLALAAQRRNKSGKARLEPVRVISREVRVQGTVAIVTELLGAAEDVPRGQKVMPRRRTIVWNKVAGKWKLYHLHTSGYTLWERAIQNFETADEQQAPTANGVVFVGSSSIVGWKTLADDFPQVKTLRRGFGGSDIIDSVAYAHRIVTPYQPRRIALYAGDNDIARGKTPERVFEDYKLFVATVHAALPDATIGFIAIKPSLARWEMWPQMAAANQQIQQYAKSHPQLDYLDIATPMLGDDHMPQSQLFAQDGLHLSPAGYAVWTKAMTAWVHAAP